MIFFSKCPEPHGKRDFFVSSPREQVKIKERTYPLRGGGGRKLFFEVFARVTIKKLDIGKIEILKLFS